MNLPQPAALTGSERSPGSESTHSTPQSRLSPNPAPSEMQEEGLNSFLSGISGLLLMLSLLFVLATPLITVAMVVSLLLGLGARTPLNQAPNQAGSRNS